MHGVLHEESQQWRVSVENCCEFETILIYIESSRLDLQSKTLSQIQGEGILNKNP